MRVPNSGFIEDVVIFYLLEHAFFDQNSSIRREAQYWMPYPWSDKSDIPKQWHHVHTWDCILHLHLHPTWRCFTCSENIHSLILGHAITILNNHHDQYRHRPLKWRPLNNGASDRVCKFKKRNRFVSQGIFPRQSLFHIDSRLVTEIGDPLSSHNVTCGASKNLKMEVK